MMKKPNKQQNNKPLAPNRRKSRQNLGFRIVLYIMLAAMLISTLAFSVSVIIGSKG